MRIDSFNDVIRFTESFINLEKQTAHYTTRIYRLDRMHTLLAHLGNPERAFRKIHLAGSKGKGSTASYLASALTALGYTTGLYLSPHLVDYRERFTLSGTFFDEELLIEAGRELVTKLEGFTFVDEWGETHPTTFELFTAFAYLLFKRAGCTWAVIETGLGGRLDATNTIEPEAVVLCPIELEHTNILGNTLTEIATEKSKIIKKAVPVFIGYEQDEAMEVFLKEVEAQKCPSYRLANELNSLTSRTTLEGEQVHIQWSDGREDVLTLRMRGKVQAQNSALALLVLEKLGLDDDSILPAFENNQLPGRFQQLAEKPYLYVYGAHTTNSLRELLYSFSSLHPDTANTVIFGALEDKDHTHMVSLILDHFSTIIISQPGTFKKSDIHALKQLIQSMAELRSEPYHILLVPDNLEALKTAYDLTATDAAILCCGSFYLAGGIKHASDQLRSGYESQLA